MTERPRLKNLVIGHFSDRRGEGPKWIGEDLGKLYFPMTVLKSLQPVDLVVRDVVKKNAEIRGLLSERGADADYQLSGEITRLYAKKSGSTEAHVLINIRLTRQEGSKEVYQKQHNVDIVQAYSARRADQVVDLLEDALNQAVAEALDAQSFRDQLETAGDA